MNANELAEAMEIRASIRRKATSRKSVQEGANDRLADQLEQASTMLRQQQAEIEALKKFSRWAYKNLTQTALQYELLGGRSEFDVNELWKLLEEKK